jgi:hypothetical protein
MSVKFTAELSLYTSAASYATVPSFAAIITGDVPVSGGGSPRPPPDSPTGQNCPPQTVCCEYDPESHTCIGGCCAKGTNCCPDGKPGSGNRCTNVESDPANCGRCNNVCPSGQRCSTGVCTSSCPAGLTLCGNACVDLSRDPTNCGACGNVCSSEACCTGKCTNTLNNDNNCGGCGIVCPPDRFCEATSCVCRWPMLECSGVCTDTSSNPNNCGACGNVCPGGKICQNGLCVCPSGSADCNGICRNLSNDTQNCGTCGNSCNGGNCVGGQCVCPPGSGLVPCGNTCANLQTDPNNCGSCGHKCNPGVGCFGGLCYCPGPQGWTFNSSESHCNTDPNTGGPVPFVQYAYDLIGLPPGRDWIDTCYCALGPANTPMAKLTPDFCKAQRGILGSITGATGIWYSQPDPYCCAPSAACGSVCCPAGQACTVQGCCPPQNVPCGDQCCALVFPPGSDPACCSGKCTDRNTNLNNCGSCGNVCPTPANATSTCTTGVCGFVCNSGYTRCGNSCVNLANDTQNCGGCLVVCPPNQACVNGRCVGPDCGNCQVCDLDSGTCGLPCSDPCTARSLRTQANSNADYQKLFGFLGTQGFSHDYDQAIILRQSGAAIGSGFEAHFGTSSAGDEALLSYGLDAGGKSTILALVRQQSSVQYVLCVDGNGVISKVIPPPEPPPSPGRSVAYSPVNRGPSTDVLQLSSRAEGRGR